MIAIPFGCTDWSSLHEIKGLLRLEDEALVLEYRVSYFGCLSRAKVHEARVPRAQIAGAALNEGWFGDTMTIRTTSLKAWEDFAGAPDGRARLSIGRAEREAARELVALLSPGKANEPVDDLI